MTTSTYASLQSHAIVFAAEASRRTGQAVSLDRSAELVRR